MVSGRGAATCDPAPATLRSCGVRAPHGDLQRSPLATRHHDGNSTSHVGAPRTTIAPPAQRRPTPPAPRPPLNDRAAGPPRVSEAHRSRMPTLFRDQCQCQVTSSEVVQVPLATTYQEPKKHAGACTRTCRIWRAAVDSCHYVARPRGSVIGKKKALPRSPAAPGSPRAGLRVAVLDDPRPLCGVRVHVSRVDLGSARLRFTWNTPTRRRTPTGVPGSPCRRAGHRGVPTRSMHGQKRTSAEGGATATQETHGPGMGG